jgi:hypothetical protein
MKVLIFDQKWVWLHFGIFFSQTHLVSMTPWLLSNTDQTLALVFETLKFFFFRFLTRFQSRTVQNKLWQVRGSAGRPSWALQIILTLLRFVLGCQMFSFQTKNTNLGKIWRALDCKMLTYLMNIWKILQTVGIFYDHLAHFVFIWYIFTVLVSCTKKNLAVLVLLSLVVFCRNFFKNLIFTTLFTTSLFAFNYLCNKIILPQFCICTTLLCDNFVYNSYFGLFVFLNGISL